MYIFLLYCAYIFILENIMIKYIIFAVLIVLLILNYTAGKVLSLILREEPSEKQVIVFKSILYVITLAGVICIMLL